MFYNLKNNFICRLVQIIDRKLNKDLKTVVKHTDKSKKGSKIDIE